MISGLDKQLYVLRVQTNIINQLKITIMLEITIYEMSRNDRNGNQYHGLVCNDGRKSGVKYKTSSEQLLRDFLGYDKIESLFDVQVKQNCIIRVYSNLGYRELCRMRK